MPMPFTVRPARSSDLDALGQMGAALAREHHAFDPQRFLMVDDLEGGYRAWLKRELTQRNAVIVAAEDAGALVGYAYGRLEERDWNALLDVCGGFHDLWVEEGSRGSGIGAALAEELMRRLVALGAPRIVLRAAAKNLAAQKLFARLGFRPTMIEMTREA